MRVLRHLLFVLAGVCAVTLAYGNSTALVIWPIAPTIAAGANTSALWLENRGTEPLTLQIRVVEWSTLNYDDLLIEEQDDVIASPPVAEIAAGHRQLVRLVRLGEPPVGREQSFRVIVDELPSPTRQRVVTSGPTLGVNLRLRYSLPLFVYGDGLLASGAPMSEHARAAAPELEWRVVDAESRRWLHVRNTGTGHARLSHVRVAAEDVDAPLSSGLLGYVLPGAERRWALPPVIGSRVDIRVDADINGHVAAGIRPVLDSLHLP